VDVVADTDDFIVGVFNILSTNRTLEHVSCAPDGAVSELNTTYRYSYLPVLSCIQLEEFK
jgi:hypothetical protein